MDTIQRRVLRIDVETGAREVVAADPVLFDFPVSAQFLPTSSANAELIVASDQEYRLAALNPLIPADRLNPPFLVVKVSVRK